MKCICSTALGGRCLWFANQDGDFWTTATVRQRQPARGMSVFKAKGSLSLTVSVCCYSHISRDDTSRSCCSCIVCICTRADVITHAANSIHRNTEVTYASSQILYILSWMHRHTHTFTHEKHILQCSFLSWMCWQMTLFNTVSSAHCFASTAMGHSQIQREKIERRESERGLESGVR